MFLDFYHLREQPFGVTPDPRFLYFGSTHREALASLLYAIETKRGFSALVAEPGMGKTSLLFRMLDSLKGSARTAFLFQTEGDSNELLRSLVHDLGIAVTGQDPVALREALNEGLLRELRAGRQVVAVIDEAQNLDTKVLETVRLLSNFETSTQKLMHIVLAGQPGLAGKLSDKGMTQLRQRVSTIIRLEPFRQDEIARYIQHRLRAAGHSGPSIFSPDALEMIARASQGIPRNINSLCFQALSIGFATQSKRIGAEVLREVLSDLNFTPESNERLWTQEPASSRPRGAETPSPSWAPRSAEPPPAAVNARLGVWDHAEYAPPRRSRAKWMAWAVCLAILPASVIALSDSKLGLAETLPGRVSGELVNAVLSSNDPNADFVPAWPGGLKPPQPPPGAETLPDTSTASASDDPGDPAALNAVATAETSGESDRRPPMQLASNTQNSRPGTVVERGKLFNGIRHETDPPRARFYGLPSTVQILRSETVFQFALEMYGQSNWKIVEAICAANPGIRNPYSVLTPGQNVRLPSDLATVTANYNSHAANGRSR